MRKLILLLIPLVLQSCKHSRILNGTYCYKYNESCFFNSCLTLKPDSTFIYKTGGDMQNYSGNGYYRFRNDRFIELTYTQPVVKSLLNYSIEPKFEKKNNIITKIYKDTTIRVIYDTISGPSALVVKKGEYYFTDSNFRALKVKTKTYSRQRKLFLGSHFYNKRNKLIHSTN